jgi:PKD repeat protein
MARWIRMLPLLAVLILTSCASNTPPTARITSPTDGAFLTQRTVQFAGEWSDPDDQVKSVLWNFGDGATSTEHSPQHTYATGGRYTVELTVTDTKNAKASTRITFSINQEPVPFATAKLPDSPDSVPSKYVSGDPPLTVQFSSAASKDPDGSITEYLWDFGDGAQSTEPNPTYTYSEPGVYEVTLTVTDDHGATAQDTSIRIEVKAPEPPVLTAGEITYRLYDRHEIGSTERGLSLLYRYVLERPQRLSREQIESVLTDAFERLKRRSRVGALTIWLFAEAKNNFMSPSDYAHFLGLLTWEASPDPAEKPQILFNEKYLSGTAPVVYGYHFDRQATLAPDTPGCPACRNYQIAKIAVYLEGETFCRVGVVNTLTEILKAFQDASGYLFDIYGKDVTFPLGSGVGSTLVPLEMLPASLLGLKPRQWDIETESLKLYLPAIPEC